MATSFKSYDDARTVKRLLDGVEAPKITQGDTTSRGQRDQKTGVQNPRKLVRNTSDKLDTETAEKHGSK